MRQEPRRGLAGLIALILFAVFAACVLSVLLTGAKAYKNVTERDRAAYEQRTCAQYVATKVRQASSGAAVRVEDAAGISCLVVTETIENEDYATRIYCYDGWLRELFTAADAEFYPDDGEKLLEAAALEFAQPEAGLLTVAITDAAGQNVSLTLYLRGEEARDEE